MTKIPGFWYVVASYAAIWVVLFAYVIFLAGRLGQLRKEIELLQGVLKKKKKKG